MAQRNKKASADKSPNSYEQPRIDSQKNGGRVVAVILGIVICMGGIGYYAVMNSCGKKVTAKPPAMETTYTPLMTGNQGHGIAQPSSEVLDALEAETPGNKSPESVNITVINEKPPAADPELEALRRRQEELRKLKMQQTQAALLAPVLIKRAPASGYTAAGAANISGSGENLAGGAGGYDSAAARDKEAFFERADNIKRDGWISPYTREAGRPFELKTGAIIPGVMVSGINSDLPGNLIA